MPVGYRIFCCNTASININDFFTWYLRKEAVTKLSDTKTERYLIINSYEANLNDPTESELYDAIMKRDLNQMTQCQLVA